ncbi:Mss4p nuclear export [Rhizoctonia solani]
MSINKRKNESNSESEEESRELVDVDFEFFGPTEIDYLALKRLLNQLFSTDSATFQVEHLTELILAQPGIGSTVKTDGIDSDPYAILTVLNMNVHKVNNRFGDISLHHSLSLNGAIRTIRR